jgi:hypothetical protein
LDLIGPAAIVATIVILTSALFGGL